MNKIKVRIFIILFIFSIFISSIFIFNILVFNLLYSAPVPQPKKALYTESDIVGEWESFWGDIYNKDQYYKKGLIDYTMYLYKDGRYECKVNKYSSKLSWIGTWKYDSKIYKLTVRECVYEDNINNLNNNTNNINNNSNYVTWSVILCNKIEINEYNYQQLTLYHNKNRYKIIGKSPIIGILIRKLKDN